MEVDTRVVFGGPRRFMKQLRLRQLGTTIQTAFMERWYGTRRGLAAPRRRRTRCLSWSRSAIGAGSGSWSVSQLRDAQKAAPRPYAASPAMAIGLTDHVWSYREYIWLQTRRPVLRQQMDAQIERPAPSLQEC